MSFRNSIQRINRRQFIRGAAGAFALPYLESIPLRASNPVPKQNLVCIGVALGLYPDEWQPSSSGSSYKSTRLLEPLWNHRNEFTIVSGTDHPEVSGGHKGAPAFLSGVYQPVRVGKSIVIKNQITLDQVAANHLGVDTRFKSLQLTSAPDSPDGALSWNEKGESLQAEADPLKVFKQLFVNESNPAAANRSLDLNRSILDLILEDTAELKKEIGSEDALRMDEYMSSIRDVEKRIIRQQKWINTSKPDALELKDSPVTFHDNLDLMLELTALALQTNSTRVVSLGIPQGGLPIVDGNFRVTNYHGQSHHGKDPQAVEELVRIERLHTRSLAKFIKRLKGIQDGDKTMLDRTQVLFGSGLGNGSSHSNRNLPILLAGGGLRHGKHLHFKAKTPLCNVYVTMLQRLGVDIDQYAGSNGNVNNEIA